MKKIKLTAMFCIILIISLPIVYAAQNNPYTTPASERAGADLLYGGSLGGYTYTQDPYSEQIRKATGGFTSGLDQYLGEAIIMYVADYQPRQLRESELEQADRPVYILLKGTHTGQLLSPFTNDPSAKDPLSGLTSIPPIDGIEVFENKTSDYSKYIRFVNYMPPRADKISLNNLGTVIVMVRKFPTVNETIPDNTITLDMNARIYLKLQESNLLGISQQDLVLKQIPDREEFIKHKDESSFFTGKGFVQATRISSDSVTLQVYNRDLYPISLYTPANTPAAAGLQPGAVITLTKGQTSPPLSFRYTGNPLSDMFQIRLEEVSTPTDKAEIEFQLDGRTTTRKIGVDKELYAGSKWILRSASVEDTSRKIDQSNFNAEIQKIAKEFKLNTQAQNEISRRISGGANFVIKEHTITLENKFTGETKEITREVLSEETGSQLAIDINPVSQEIADLIENSYCDGNANVPGEDYACVAIKKYKELINKYPTSPEAAKAKRDLAEIYDSAAIEFTPCLTLSLIKYQNGPYQKALDECYTFQQDMLELAFYYYSLIGEQSKIKNKYGGKGGEDFLEDAGIPLKLIKVITKDEEKGTASVRLYDKPGKYSENKYTEKDILDFAVDYKGNKNYKWRIDSLYPTSLTLRLYEVPNNDKTCKNCKATSESMTLKLNEQKDVPIEYPEKDTAGQKKTKSLMVTQIDSRNEAYITILPGAGRGFVASSFKIHIPVDPRPFKWTPEQLESQIKTTKELVEDLDDIIKKLDKFVTSMKKICLGVFAFLTIKNSFTGIRNIARRQVSESYKQKCQTEVAEGKTEKHEDFKRLEICLDHYSSEISSAVEKTEEHMREINSKIKGKAADEIEDNIASEDEQVFCGRYEKFKTASKVLGKKNQEIIKQYRDCLLNAKVQLDPDLDGSYKEALKKKFDEVDTKKTTEIYDEAWNIAANSWGKWNRDNSTHIQKIINQIEFDRQRKKEEVESNTLQIQLTNTEQGKWYGEAILEENNVYKSTTLKGLSQYELIVYENGIKDANGSKKYVCEKLLGENWDNSNNNCNGNGQNKDKLVDTKINQLKLQPAQEGTSQKFVTKEFYERTYNTASGVLNGCEKDCKPVYYYSASILDTAGRQISSEYSGSQLTAYYDKDGLPYCYPVGNGNYVKVIERSQGPSQEIKSFKVMNVGPNGKIECGSGDDENIYLPEELNLPNNLQNKKNFLNKEPKAKCTNPGKTQVASIMDGKPVICESADKALGLSSLVKPQCIDVMDSADCKIMFNFCDPVMCPSSRCTLGGRVERNVIQSGVIGSTVLCLPNIKQGIVMPVCLTGISAGLKGIKSILEGYQFCLETNLKEGRDVGLCDYIRSVGICEVVWKEAYNLLDIGGKGIIDWVTGAIETKGGGEYLQFQTSLNNVGDSVRTFTEEYKTTYTAQFLSQSTEEIGSQICRLSVNGKLPSVGKILDQLTEPENPPQFTAFFDISPYASPGETLPVTPAIPGGTQEISRYKVFYHIYAGTGFYQGSYSQPVSLFNPQTQFGPPQPITYSIYLINKELGLPPLYVTFPDENPFQPPGKLDQNKFVQETVQKIGPKGYNQICVNINGIENCGFKRVSSSFGLREMQDALTGDEAAKKIDSAEKCVPSSRSSPEYSVAKLGAVAGFQLAAGATGTGIFQPQAGAVGTGVATSGIEEGLFSTGIVRLCAIEPPTTETGRWKEVGTCGQDERQKTLGKCWLDLKSVSIEDRKFNEEFLRELRERADPNIQIIEAEKAKSILFALNKERNDILDSIRAEVAKVRKGEAPEVTRTVSVTTAAPAGEGFLTKEKKEKDLSPYIRQIADRYPLDNEINTYFFLKAIIMRESTWNTKSVSCANAAGLVQLIPSTARNLNLSPVLEDLNSLGTIEKGKKVGCRFKTDKSENELAKEDARFNDEKAIDAMARYFIQLQKILSDRKLPITIENLAAMYHGGPGIIKDKKISPGQKGKNYSSDVKNYYNQLVAQTHLATIVYAEECGKKQRPCFNQINGISSKIGDLKKLNVDNVGYKNLQDKSEDLTVRIESLYEEASLYKNLAVLRSQIEILPKETLKELEVKRVEVVQKSSKTKESKAKKTESKKE